MIIVRGRRIAAAALLLASVAAMPAIAQTGNGSAPQTLPDLGNFSLPASQPTPTPTPAPTPVSTATPVVVERTGPTASPTPRTTPTARATPTPRPAQTPQPTPEATVAATPTPASTPAPSASPASVPTAEAEPAPTPASTPTAAAPPATMAPEQDGTSGGWLIGGALLALLAGAGAWWWRRQGGKADAPPARPVTNARPQPVAPPPPVTADLEPLETITPVPQNRPRLTLALRPRRAGLNLLSATVEAELLIRNDGPATASAIRIGATLVGAAAGQGGDVAAIFSQPVTRPATPPFALAPGEERQVRLVVALPRTDIAPLDAAGRAMFVPVVAINALYATGEGTEGQSATAFAIGIERVDSAKLAPFWLDQPARMHEQLGVRPYGVSVER